MLGDVVNAYSAAVAALGYTENKVIDDPEYKPASSADKSYYVQASGKGSENRYTGNMETTSLSMMVTLLIRYPNGKTFAANEKAAWNEVCKVDKGIYALAATRQDAVTVEVETPERIEDFKVFRLAVNCVFERALT